MFKLNNNKKKDDCITVAFRLPIAHTRKLRDLAKKHKLTVSFICRQMIEHCLEEL